MPGRAISLPPSWCHGIPERAGGNHVVQPLPRFARILQTVTIEAQIDLEARTVFQVLVDHTAPLLVCGLAQEDDAHPALSQADEKLALHLAQRSDLWPAP